MAKAIKARKFQGKKVFLSEDFMDSIDDLTPWEFREFSVHSDEELDKLLNNLSSLELRERFGANSADTWDF